MLYVFVVIEHSTRPLRPVNVTANSSADCTLQQLKKVVGAEREYEYLIHDRDRIFSKHLDASIEALGLEVLQSPVTSPKVNSICESVIGTIRRECLDWLIVLSEGPLKQIQKDWIVHYNRGRPHSVLGPGVIGPPRESTKVRKSETRHQLATGTLVRVTSVLGGLHHETTGMQEQVSRLPRH